MFFSHSLKLVCVYCANICTCRLVEAFPAVSSLCFTHPYPLWFVKDFRTHPVMF